MFLKMHNQNKGYWMKLYCLSGAFAQIKKFYIKNNWSLQAQSTISGKRKRKRTSCLTSCVGVATIETALILPIFLCAVCMLMTLGQMLLTEAEIQHASVKTAFICARQEALTEIQAGSQEKKNRSKEEQTQGISYNKSNFLGKTLSIPTAFYSVFQDSSGIDSCIHGGKAGIRLSSSEISREKALVEICADYRLKVFVPFFRGIYFPRRAVVRQRIFSGYVEHKGEAGTGKEDKIVYLAENGTVYHTSLSCTHICIHITDANAIHGVVDSSRYQPCERCIKNGEAPKQLYITAYGDRFHSSITCSGLKRTLRAVKLSEIPGMRICARCAAGIH